MGMNEKDYKQIEGLRSSVLVELLRSPAHAKHAMENDSLTSKSLEIGTLTHILFLEPDKVNEHFALRPKKPDGTELRANSKEYKDWYNEVAEQDKTIVCQKDFDTAHKVAEALSNKDKVQELKRDFVAVEELYTWKSENHNVLCKARIDARTSNALIDLKTTSDASPDKFSRSCFIFNYHIKLAHYLEGLRMNGIKVDTVYIIAAETTGLFEVVVYEISKEMIDLGTKIRNQLLELYYTCKAFDSWPGYSDDVIELNLPRYAYKREEEEQELLFFE